MTSEGASLATAAVGADCPLTAATGGELVHVIRRTAARRGVTMSALVRAHVGERPDRFTARLQMVQRPSPDTVVKVRAMIAAPGEGVLGEGGA